MTTRRIISSDSHVSVQHDDVKAHLASRFHDDYDAALAQALPRDAGRQRGEGQRRRYRDPARLVGPARVQRPARAAARHGHRRRRHRGPLLRGERVPLPLPAPQRRGRSHPRVQRHLARLRVGRPEPARSSPTRCRSTTSTSRWPRSSGSRRSAASRCSSRCSPPSSASSTTSTSATTACGRRSRRAGCRSAATSASTPRSTTSPTATRPLASRGRSRACRRRRAKRSACGCSPGSSPATRS